MWKGIKGYENKYQVSDDGKVRSLQRHINNGSANGMTLACRILKQTKNPHGYYQVSLMNNGIRSVRYVHRLVAEAFIQNTNDLPVVNHIDGNKSNNCVDNLEFVSYHSNNQHAYDTGLHKKGNDHYRSVLSDSDVKQIRREGKYTTYEKIGNKYNVSKATIRDVLTGRTWA